jgi:hypothetical protein
MRDLKALLESQEVDLDHNTVNRALELNGELAKLKEENEKLKKENRLRKDKEELLLEEVEQREEILAATEAEIKRLKEETHRQKVSLDSMFNDLEESKKLVTKLRKDLFDRQFGSESNVNRPDTPEEGQAQFLTSVVGKPAQSNSFFSSIGGANSAQQRKIYNLEKENVKLKSELVRLLAQYREESYLHRKAIEELAEENATVATASLDGSLSLCEDSDDSNSSEHNRRPNLARSNSLRRIKEYKERKSSLPTHMISPGASMVRQPRRIGSLHSNLSRGSSMVDSDDDDRPSALRGAPPRPQRVQSLWPGATHDQGTSSRTANSPAIPRPPRRIQSHQPSPPDRAQINLHQVEQDEPSRGSLFGRSQSIRRMGWWQ